MLVLKKIVFSKSEKDLRNNRINELTDRESSLVIRATAHCRDTFITRRVFGSPRSREQEQEQAWLISSEYLTASLGCFEAVDFKAHIRCEVSARDVSGRVLRQVVDVALLHRLAIFYSAVATLTDRAKSLCDLQSLVDVTGGAWEESLIPYSDVLKKDPSGIYPKMDWPSRAAYLDRIVHLAVALGVSEISVATASLILAERLTCDDSNHIGYFLFDDGVEDLCSSLGRPNLLSNCNLDRGSAWQYIVFQIILAVGFSALAGVVIDGGTRVFMVFYLALISIIAADNLKGIVELILGEIAGHRRSLAIDYMTAGLPDKINVLIAVPVHLINDVQWKKALSTACWNLGLSNDTNVSLVFLTDFPDSNSPGHSESERMLLSKAISDVESCSGLLKGHKLDIHLLHRRRQFVASEGCWMGFERKRGKLRSLHKLILDDIDDFSVASERARATCRAAEYILCIDEDTRLSRNSVQRMAGFLAHPMNRLRRSRDNNYLGHGIVVPCVMTDRDSANNSWRWPRFTVGPTADPRSDAAVRRSSFYDWFGVAPYGGKGMYSPRQFEELCGARIPDGVVLSHDTMEAAWLRPGYMDSALITDSYPTSFRSFIERQDRWVRGDLQNAALVLSKVLCVDRRPPPATYFTIWTQLNAWLSNVAVFVAAACLAALNAAVEWYGFLFLAMLIGGYQRLLVNLYQDRMLLQSLFIKIYIPYFARIHLAQLLRLVSSPVHASLFLRAFYLTCFRLALKRNLLQWRSSASVDLQERKAGLFYNISCVLSISMIIALFAALSAERGVIPLAIIFTWTLLPLLDVVLVRSPRNDG